MNEQQLKTALAVAQTGSITRASAELFLSVQGVKDRIDALERELGCTLFNRTNKGVTLTESGRAFARDAPELLEHIVRFTSSVSHPDGQIETLVIGTWPNKSISIMDKMCLEFARRYPNVKLSFSPTTVDRFYEDVRDGTVDLSFVRDAPCPAGVTFTPVEGLVTTFKCVMATDSKAAEKLSGFETVYLDMLGAYRVSLVMPWNDRMFDGIAIEKLLPYDIYEVLNFCRDGGVCICDEYFDTEKPQLLSIPIERSGMANGCIHRPNPSRAVLDFIDVASEIALRANR